MEFPVKFVQDHFPALKDSKYVYLDNAAGAQVPEDVIKAVGGHLTGPNVQRGGRHRFSEEVAHVVGSARESLATLVNGQEPGEIVGWSALIRREAYAAAAICNGNVELLKLDREQFFNAMAEKPEDKSVFFENIATLLGNRILDLEPFLA